MNELTNEQILEIFVTTHMAMPFGCAWKKERIALARAVIAADRAQRVPDGWRLVPVEPTIAMCIAGDSARFNTSDPTRTAPIYRAMLSAAPSPASPAMVSLNDLDDGEGARWADGLAL